MKGWGMDIDIKNFGEEFRGTAVIHSSHPPITLMEAQDPAPLHSQQITWREFYDDSDAESEYSVEGFDPNFLGPPPALESFPRFTEKRPRRQPTTKLNKRDYWVLREASPHELWYCEYPLCSSYLIPYVQWGVRHHCRACGLTVCADHCTRNITLSSAILTPLRADPTDESTAVLATSLDPSQLPPVVTLKYACLQCCDKATAGTVKHTRKTAQALVPTTVSVVANAVALPDSDGVQSLLTALTEVRAQLQIKTQDVCQMSGEVSEYRACMVGMKSVIRNLEAQLAVAQTEGKLSTAGAKKLRQLRRELRALICDNGLGGGASSPTSSASSASGSAAVDCAEVAAGSDDEAGSTDGSTVGDSPCPRGRGLSLDGVNEVGHPAPRPAPAANSATKRVPSRYVEQQQQQQQKIPQDPFYAGVVTRACGDLPAVTASPEGVTAKDTTTDGSGPVRVAKSATDEAAVAPRAEVSDDKVKAVINLPLHIPFSVAAPDAEDSTGPLSPLAVEIDTPVSCVAPTAPAPRSTCAASAAVPRGVHQSPRMFTAAPPSLDTTAAVQTPANPCTTGPASGARPRPLGGSPLPRPNSAYVEFADVYSEHGEYVPAAEDEGREARIDSDISVPLTPHPSVTAPLSRVMSATPAFAEIYFCPSSEDCEFNGSFGTDEGRFSPRTPVQQRTQRASTGHQTDPTLRSMMSLSSAASSVFRLLEGDDSRADLHDNQRSGGLRRGHEADHAQQCSSQDTNDTVATFESADDLTYSAKDPAGRWVTPAETSGVAGHSANPAPAGGGGEPVPFNPLRLKRKSV